MLMVVVDNDVSNTMNSVLNSTRNMSNHNVRTIFVLAIRIS